MRPGLPAILTRAAPRVADPGGGRPNLLAYVNGPALIATLIWAGNQTGLKVALADLDPIVIGMLRMGTAGLVLLAIVVARDAEPGLPRRAWPHVLLVGGLGIGLNTICYLLGLNLTSVTNAVLISTLSPVFCMAMAVALGQERLERRRLAGVLLALLGVAVLLGAEAVVALGQGVVGGLFLVGAAVSWAAYSVLGGRLLSSYGALKATAYSLLAGALTLAVASPVLVRRWDIWHAGPAAWGGVAYAAIMSSVVALTLWNVGIKRAGATSTMLYSYLSPVLTIAIAAVLLGERLSPWQALGGAVILAGLAVSSRRA